MTDGIYDIPADAYHADNLGDGQPSLSASIANVLLASSPKHAWAKHPRLNPAYAKEAEAKYDVGTACHSLLLEGRNAIAVVDADSWRTKDAQALRDSFRAEGRVPLLAKDALDVALMCEAIQDQLDHLEIDPPLLSQGQPEQTLLWHEPNGVCCRARVDWLADDHTYVTDIKTTSRSANPSKFSRTMFDLGYDVQAAFYRRGVERLTGIVPEFRLLVCETSAPYAVSVMGLAPSAVELADAKVDYAIATWARCLESGVWPSYPTQVAYAEPPAWELARWLEKEAMEEAVA
jgi:hypothetical protein